MTSEQELTGPDFAKGVSLSDIPQGGMLQGHVGGVAVLLARVDKDVFAVSATCTHYGAPLKDGKIVGDTIRCPWHHACFSLKTGAPLRPPARNDLERWKVEKRGQNVVVGRKLPRPARPRVAQKDAPTSVLILGAGAAGNAAAETLRREGYRGPVTVVDVDTAGPVDRPNLSKDYLAGNAPEDWMPLHPPQFYEEQGIELVLGRSAIEIDVAKRTVAFDDRSERTFGALLIATGAEPVKPPIPNDGARVHYLRTLADSRAIIASAQQSKRVAVVGAGFIGLEVAAALRARGLEVHVIAPEAIPLERIMGTDVGRWIRRLHEEKGVVFHLGESAKAFHAAGVELASGATVPADFIVVGVGVRPNDTLARAAGLTVDRGIVVNEFLQTSGPAIYAAGDVARWPMGNGNGLVRIEHWVVAERQGQVAARNMLGRRITFDAVPFFWSAHYDVSINYVGHAERWDAALLKGDLDRRDASVTYSEKGKTLAVATVWRDAESLEAELELERQKGETGDGKREA